MSGSEDEFDPDDDQSFTEYYREKHGDDESGNDADRDDESSTADSSSPSARSGYGRTSPSERYQDTVGDDSETSSSGSSPSPSSTPSTDDTESNDPPTDDSNTTESPSGTTSQSNGRDDAPAETAPRSGTGSGQSAEEQYEDSVGGESGPSTPPSESSTSPPPEDEDAPSDGPFQADTPSPGRDGQNDESPTQSSGGDTSGSGDPPADPDSDSTDPQTGEAGDASAPTDGSTPDESNSPTEFDPEGDQSYTEYYRERYGDGNYEEERAAPDSNETESTSGSSTTTPRSGNETGVGQGPIPDNADSQSDDPVQDDRIDFGSVDTTQGVELDGDPEIAQKARDLEDRVVEQIDGVTETGVEVVRTDDGRLRAQLNDAGRAQRNQAAADDIEDRVNDQLADQADQEAIIAGERGRNPVPAYDQPDLSDDEQTVDLNRSDIEIGDDGDIQLSESGAEKVGTAEETIGKEVSAAQLQAALTAQGQPVDLDRDDVQATESGYALSESGQQDVVDPQLDAAADEIDQETSSDISEDDLVVGDNGDIRLTDEARQQEQEQQLANAAEQIEQDLRETEGRETAERVAERLPNQTLEDVSDDFVREGLDVELSRDDIVIEDGQARLSESGLQTVQGAQQEQIIEDFDLRTQTNVSADDVVFEGDEARLTDQALAEERQADRADVEDRIIRDLERQTGTDLDRDQIQIEETESGLRADLTEEARRDLARQRVADSIEDKIDADVDLGPEDVTIEESENGNLSGGLSQEGIETVEANRERPLGNIQESDAGRNVVGALEGGSQFIQQNVIRPAAEAAGYLSLSRTKQQARIMAAGSQADSIPEGVVTAITGEGEAVEESAREQVVESGTEGIGIVIDVPGATQGLVNAGDYIGAGAAATVSGETDEFVAESEEAAAEVQAQVVEQVTENPVETTAMLAGSLVGSAGLTAGAARLSGAAGRAVPFAFQPGEELLTVGTTTALKQTARGRRLLSRLPNNKVDPEEIVLRGADRARRSVQKRTPKIPDPADRSSTSGSSRTAADSTSTEVSGSDTSVRSQVSDEIEYLRSRFEDSDSDSDQASTPDRDVEEMTGNAPQQTQTGGSGQAGPNSRDRGSEDSGGYDPLLGEEIDPRSSADSESDTEPSGTGDAGGSGSGSSTSSNPGRGQLTLVDILRGASESDGDLNVGLNDRGQMTLSLTRTQARQESESDQETTVRERATGDLPPVDAFESEQQFAAERDLRIARERLRDQTPESVESAQEMFESQQAYQDALVRRAAEQRLSDRLGTEDPRDVLAQDTFESEVEGFAERIREQRASTQTESDQDAGQQVEQQLDQDQATAGAAGSGGQAETSATPFRGESDGEAGVQDQDLLTQEVEPSDSPYGAGGEVEGEITPEPGRATEVDVLEDQAVDSQIGVEVDQFATEETAFASELADTTEDSVGITLESQEADSEVAVEDESGEELIDGFDTETEVSEEFGVEFGTETVADSDTESAVEFETETETETDTEFGIEFETETEAETEVELGLETEAEAETESEVETEVELQQEPESETETEPFLFEEAEGDSADDSDFPFAVDEETFDTGIASADDLLSSEDSGDDTFGGSGDGIFDDESGSPF